MAVPDLRYPLHQEGGDRLTSPRSVTTTNGNEARMTETAPDPLDADALAQFRGCEPADDCYFECCQVAREDIAEDRDPAELEQARTWAAAQDWWTPSETTAGDEAERAFLEFLDHREPGMSPLDVLRAAWEAGREYERTRGAASA